MEEKMLVMVVVMCDEWWWVDGWVRVEGALELEVGDCWVGARGNEKGGRMRMRMRMRMRIRIRI